MSTQDILFFCLLILSFIILLLSVIQTITVDIWKTLREINNIKI